MKALFLSVFFSLLFIFYAFAQDSTASFNNFINRSPTAKANMEQVLSSEELISACMEGKTKIHLGVKMQKNGQISIFQKNDSDRKELSRFLANNKDFTDKIFAMKEESKFEELPSDYKPNGETYCYVQNRLGTNHKTISWPERKTASTNTKQLPAVKEIFESMLGISKQIVHTTKQNQ